MADQVELLECPMCSFSVLPGDDYVLQLHFEQVHTTDSPFVITESRDSPPLPSLPRPISDDIHIEDMPSLPDEEATVECTEPDCGELVQLSDLNEHLDYHGAETLSFDETTGKYHSHTPSIAMKTFDTASERSDAMSNATSPEGSSRKGHKHSKKIKKQSPRARSSTTTSEKSTLSRSIISFNPFVKLDKFIRPPSSTGRLGKSELGPYAWEDQMPKWLYDQLDNGPKISVVNRIGRDGRLIKQEQVQNESPGLLPVLAQLSALDRSVKQAYYCNPSTLHIGKTPREGGFCGYRNIQMLLSYIQGAKAQGCEEFPGRTPGILKLQDCIEDAWDHNINTIGRTQTGGIKGSRKYIGTPEAQAFFLNSEINCAVEMFTDSKHCNTEAHESLLASVERYFSRAAAVEGSNVCRTLLPPIYLQQPGHSITIVGFERHHDGTCNLVVFDPMYSTSPAMHKLIGRKGIRNARSEVMHAYRRGAKQLKKHAAFEILMLTATPPLFPAWDVLRQFPDCRYVYVFFRSRTLGYDVYPEDCFLSSFPWQQYGGLWICDESRFARAEPINLLVAQRLQQLTSDGLQRKPRSSTSSWKSLPEVLGHGLSLAELSARGERQLASISTLTEASQWKSTSPINGLDGVTSNMSQITPVKPELSGLTDVGRRYPGFPTLLSPPSFPLSICSSPKSEVHIEPALPRYTSPRPSFSDPFFYKFPRGPSLSRDRAFSSQVGLIDDILARTNASSSELLSSSFSPMAPASLIFSMSPLTMSPCTPPRALTTAVKTIELTPPPSPRSTEGEFNDVKLKFHSRTVNLSPSITIANGTETNIASPINPTGTALLYTSNRRVGSGLLSVHPLSEAQVAEYRFWRPCGRHSCTFGCGSRQQGERAAAKRLFKDAGNVEAEYLANLESSASNGSGLTDASLWGSRDGAEEVAVESPPATATWAGRRLVKDWGSFLGECEREGVARF